MSDHYFSRDPDPLKETRHIYAKLCGETFQFLTGGGVFSKKGIDFGSRLLIESINLPSKGSILDLGCGYGPIGIACARFEPSSSVTMVDINPQAIQLAIENVRLNQVEEQVKVIQSDGFSAVKDQKFDMVVTNPPIRTGKKNVYGMFSDAYLHLNANGELWTVIRKKQGASSAFDELNRIFPEVEVVRKKKGYWILRAAKEI